MVLLASLFGLAVCQELGNEGEFIDLYKLYEEHVQRKKDEKLRADHENYVKETKHSIIV
jgi:hypothetical protein